MLRQTDDSTRASDSSANGYADQGSTRMRGRRAAPQPLLAVIVPTRNEVGNVAKLVARIEQAVDVRRTELVFVDDSSDETPAEIERVAREARIRVRMLHRTEEERIGGLGGAVAAGFRSIEATWACVIDGDLQHPPELIPDLIAKAEREELDLVVASRYSGDGDLGEFGHIRTLISRSFTIAARVTFPRRLRGVTDPLSGFFLVRRD